MPNKQYQIMRFYTIPQAMVERLLSIGTKSNKILPFNNIDYEPQAGA